MTLLKDTIELLRPESETYRLALPTGDEIEMRHVRGVDEIAEINRKAGKTVEMVRDRTAPPELLKQGVKDEETITQAVYLRALYVASWRRVEKEGDAAGFEFVEEKEAPTLEGWLEFAQAAPFAFKGLWIRVDEEVSGRAELQRKQGIESAKKESSETPTGSPSSEPAGTAGASTLTNS